MYLAEVKNYNKQKRIDMKYQEDKKMNIPQRNLTCSWKRDLPTGHYCNDSLNTDTSSTNLLKGNTKSTNLKVK